MDFVRHCARYYFLVKRRYWQFESLEILFLADVYFTPVNLMLELVQRIVLVALGSMQLRENLLSKNPETRTYEIHCIPVDKPLPFYDLDPISPNENLLTLDNQDHQPTQLLRGHLTPRI